MTRQPLRACAMFLCAALALAAAVAGVRAAEAPPRPQPLSAAALAPMLVSVQCPGKPGDAAALPVQFLAPLPTGGFNRESFAFLIAPDKTRYVCQVTQLGGPADGRGYFWARLSALVPYRAETYLLAWEGRNLPADVPAVSTMVALDAAALEAGRVRLVLHPARANVFQAVYVQDEALVPRHVEELMNPQQGMELVLLDRIRRIESVLRPQGRPEFVVEEVGPVSTTAVYRGEFGADGARPVRYEARVTLMASGVVAYKVRLPSGSYNPATHEPLRIRITLPVLLDRASEVAFGGGAQAGGGRPYWTGDARLAVAADGSYDFVDGDGTSVSGPAPVTWADYSDGDSGVALLWGAQARPLDLSVDYNEDIVSLSLKPLPAADALAEARVHFVFHRRRADADTLAALAEAIDKPLAATINEDYVRVITSLK